MNKKRVITSLSMLVLFILIMFINHYKNLNIDIISNIYLITIISILLYNNIEYNKIKSILSLGVTRKTLFKKTILVDIIILTIYISLSLINILITKNNINYFIYLLSFMLFTINISFTYLMIFKNKSIIITILLIILSFVIKYLMNIYLTCIFIILSIILFIINIKKIIYLKLT